MGVGKFDQDLLHFHDTSITGRQVPYIVNVVIHHLRHWSFVTGLIVLCLMDWDVWFGASLGSPGAPSPKPHLSGALTGATSDI